MNSIEIIYINFTGGIVSPGYLREVLEIAADAKVKNVRFGLRQQLILEIPVKQFAAFSNACASKNIQFAKKKEAFPNIVSSYPAVDIFSSDTWVREGVYKDIFNLFDYTPAIKVNITDSNQNFVPFFTGHVNWVSSGSAHFWYLYVRFPKTEHLYCFPDLVYTNDIGAISKHVEVLITAKKIANGNELYKQLKATKQFISKPIEKQLQPAKFSMPYYEGFNKYNNNYWLGIYRREEMFPIQFLLDVCLICLQTKIGEMYTTPWKSIVVKGIESRDRNLWDYALGKFRINVRHAANELNWQIEDNCEDGLQIKRHIIRYFDKEDVRTYGLCFAVKTKLLSSLFGSVIVRQQEVRNPGRLKALERFEILYTADFNPNTVNLITFRKDVEKMDLGTYLVSLCKYFYERESCEKSLMIENLKNQVNDDAKTPAEKVVHQCGDCFTIYDEAFGDPDNNIVPGTAFIDLPELYHCPLCDAGKESFVAVNEDSLELIVVD
jgi:rubredoxin